jgi:hypothetical protein
LPHPALASISAGVRCQPGSVADDAGPYKPHREHDKHKSLPNKADMLNC